MKIDRKGSTNMNVIVGIVGIVIVACLVIGLGCAISDEHDDDNFPHNGLGVLDDDEALDLWKMSQL